MYGTGFRSDLKNKKYITYISDHTLQYYYYFFILLLLFL